MKPVLPQRSPTTRLLAGLAVTLTAVAVFSLYNFAQLRGLEEMQTTAIDRNRADSLLLLRIQNNLNSLALTMRDMLDGAEPYPLTAWQAPMKRIRTDLDDAVAQESPQQRQRLASDLKQFWDALDRVFAMAASGREQQAREQIRFSLEARQQTLNAAVARFLVSNNESEQQTSERVKGIYARVERNGYWFLASMLVLIVGTSLYVVQANRRMFEQVAALSQTRSELARQLIGLQENTFRSISRELHDEFGQILTAMGAMLQRSARSASLDERTRTDLREVQEIAQSTLEKVRTLSRALHPVALDEDGFERAVEDYLAGFEKQTGVAIRYTKEGESREVDRDLAIHLYRVLQEALNNVVRHSKSKEASVTLLCKPRQLALEVADRGIGFSGRGRQGMGLVGMRERAQITGAKVEFLDREGGGALVRFTVPL